MKKTEWYEIIVPDPSFLSGKFIVSILNMIKDELNIKFAVLDGLSGADVSELSNNYLQKIVELDSVLPLIAKAVQFDWCDFFLFDKDGVIPNEKQFYDEVIRKTTATVRAVDDTYVYIYTQDEGLVNKIKDNNPHVEINRGELSVFDYPE